MRSSRARAALLAAGAALLAAPSAAPAALRLPVAAHTDRAQLEVRVRPQEGARVVARVPGLRDDFRRSVVHAIARRRDAAGAGWYRVRLAGRPNGRTGWVRAAHLTGVRSVAGLRIEIDRSARRLVVLRGRRAVLRARVAVGAPGAPTPTGRFFLAARFRPRLAVLGAYAFETSAGARLTDWPGGGLVGLHGTSQPGLIGQAVSHGCVRLSDRDVLRLARRVPLGIAVRIRP